jgi:hypothetical protein
MAESPTAQGPLDRLAAFRFVYIGIFAYVVLSVASIELTENLLQGHFVRAIHTAVRVSPSDGPVVPLIQERVRRVVRDSFWTRIGGVRVTPVVLGFDGLTPIYLEGATLPPPLEPDPASIYERAEQLLPAITTVQVSLPLDSLLAGAIWVFFGAILIPILFAHSRRVARREQTILEAAVAARDATVERARSIQGELEKVRDKVSQLEPAERAHAEEIAGLERERSSLQNQLRELGRREKSLRERAARSSDLDQERRALEDLLEEAVQDLDQKEGEIRTLQERLKNAARGGGRGRTRGAEQLGKRLNTLYRNLRFDDRAIDDIVALGDETLRLRAEECLKKLDDDPDSAAVRRKVGGLPAQLSIFELGFAGKGRIYYARTGQGGFRILAVGGKASQKSDLEYLSRLSL